MQSSLICKLKTLKKRKKIVENLLNKSEIFSDKEKFFIFSKEYSKLCEIDSHFEKWKKVKENIISIQPLLQDTEICDMAKEEIKNCNQFLKKIEKKIQELLLPKDLNDEYGCFLEIRAGTGGNEAALFAGDLFKMYSKFAEIHFWKLEIINTNYGEHGGYKEIVVKIPNKSAYSKLKFESGGHRVQRIPETESQGRIHTSTCTVAVIPCIPDKELPKINIEDLRIDTFRSSGVGGQHVNTTDSAIRITHLPTGLVVECQDERSQHKNKSRALSVLRSRLQSAELKKRQEKESSIRRNLLGSGDRSDRIRTYNFSKGRVTDHRINTTLYTLEEILKGKLDLLINPIIRQYKLKQLKEFSGKYDEMGKMVNKS